MLNGYKNLITICALGRVNYNKTDHHVPTVQNKEYGVFGALLRVSMHHSMMSYRS